MSDRFLAAAVQMNSRLDKEANVATAVRLVEEAHRQGAQLVVLPEMFNMLGPFPDVIAAAEPIPGPTSKLMAELARRLEITLLAGSICEAATAATNDAESAQGNVIPPRGSNTSLLFLPDGSLAARYRKVHLFNVDLPGRVEIEESRYITAGDKIVSYETSLARLGLSICYDLRFPELYRRLADEDAELILTPAAFTRTTGQAHWELLLRARAVENQAYLIGANQCGSHGGNLESYGHSMIIDPWGEVLASASDEEAVITAEIDLSRLREIRAQLPALRHRRNI